MVGEPQGVMRVASQIWQVVFALQTLPIFCLALRKKAQYVVVQNRTRGVKFVLRNYSSTCTSFLFFKVGSNP